MPYDFTTRFDRTHDGSTKWQDMYDMNPDVSPEAVPVSTADMEFRTAPAIVDALVDRVSNHALGYTSATDEFFDAVLGWQERRHGWRPERDWLCYSPGVIPALHAACLLFSEPGDGIIIQPPVYYPFMAASAKTGRVRVDNPLVLGDDGRWHMDYEDLERKAADPRNKVILVSSPANPVGRVWSAEELRRMADICLANDVFIACDEIHNDLVMPGYEHTTLANVLKPEELEHVMICTAPSKTFNLPALHVSTVFIPGAEAREAYKKHRAAVGRQSLNGLAYTACIAAYNESEDWLDELLQVVAGNAELVRERLAEAAPELRVTPLEGTYLLWVDFRAWGLTNEDLEALMLRHDLFTNEGYLFGQEGSGFERLNLACPRSVVEWMVGQILEARAEVMGR